MPARFVDLEFLRAVGFAHGIVVPLAEDAAVVTLRGEDAGERLRGLPGPHPPAVLVAGEGVLAEHPGGALRPADRAFGVSRVVEAAVGVARQGVEEGRAQERVA